MNINDKIGFFTFAKEKFNKWFGGYDSLIIPAGADNQLFELLLNYFDNVPEHGATIIFMNDLIVGAGINKDDIDIWTLKKITLDFILFGSFCLLRDGARNGKTLEMKWLDMSKCRLDKKLENIIYHEKDLITNQTVKTEYPLISNVKESGVFYFKNYLGRDYYGRPAYMQIGKVLDTMQSVITYNQDQTANGFSSTLAINVPGASDQTVLKNFEKSLKVKFVGEQGQRFIVTASNTKDDAVTFNPIENPRFDESFELMYKTLRNQIIMGHRLTNIKLLGGPDEGSGFSTTEYNEALDVYKTIVIEGFRIELEHALTSFFDSEIKFVDKQVVSNVQQVNEKNNNNTIENN